jgi:DnaJ-class molecular chaperone
MNPFAVLGLPNNASKEDAKRAYRSLASKHHPDHGGSAEEFKKIKAAWEQIEGGFTQQTPPTQPKHTAKSSFSDPEPNTKSNHYSKSKGFSYPNTYQENQKTRVNINISHTDWFTGCTIYFKHKGKLFEYELRPATSATTFETTCLSADAMIGKRTDYVNVIIRLIISQDTDVKHAEQRNEQRKGNDLIVERDISALGIFTGGIIKINDAEGKIVEVTIKPGQNPAEEIVIPNRGFKTLGAQGDLIVKIRPLFNSGYNLTDHEKNILNKLIEIQK